MVEHTAKIFFQEDLKEKKLFTYHYWLEETLRGRLGTPVIVATENTTCWSQGEARYVLSLL